MKTTEKRTAVCYGYVKPTNVVWIKAQAKKKGLKVSPTLDLYLDKLRKQYPIKK